MRKIDGKISPLNGCKIGIDIITIIATPSEQLGIKLNRPTNDRLQLVM